MRERIPHPEHIPFSLPYLILKKMAITKVPTSTVKVSCKEESEKERRRQDRQGELLIFPGYLNTGSSILSPSNIWYGALVYPMSTCRDSLTLIGFQSR